MPNAGHIVKWGNLKMRVESVIVGSGSGTIGTPTFSHSAAGVTDWTPDKIGTAQSESLVFVSLAVQSSSASGGSWSASYNGPNAPFGGYNVGAAAYLTDVSMDVVFKDVIVYCILTGSLWRTLCSGIDIYANGVLQTSLGGFDVTSNGTGPSYVPYFGVPLHLSGGPGASTTGIGTLPTTYSYSASATSTISGGWEFQEAGSGTWEPLAVTLPPDIGAPAGTGCPFGLGLDGILESTSTWGTQLQGYSYEAASNEIVGTQTATLTVNYYCGSTLVGSETGVSDCYVDGVHHSPVTRNIYGLTADSESYSGAVTVYPDLLKTVKRMQPGYRALWLRSGNPETRSSRTRSCTTNSVTTSWSETPTIHPSQAVLLGGVGDAPHAIEDTLGYHTYAPCSAGHTKSHSISYTPEAHEYVCLCPPSWAPPLSSITCSGGEGEAAGASCALNWSPLYFNLSESETVGYLFPAYVETSAHNGQMFGYQDHDVDVVRYINFWGNPHWNYCLWFPKNTIDSNGDGIPDQQNQWPVDSAPIAREYWMLDREQWQYQSALPVGEQRKTRTSSICSPIQNECGQTPFLDTYFDTQRWLGISRFSVQAVAFPASIALDASSAAAWTITGGTMSFGGGGVTITPAGAGAVTLTYDMGRWTEAPFMYPHWVMQIGVNWDATNIKNPAISLLGIDASSVSLATAPGTYNRPSGPATKFAGSWAIDNGAGYITDVGTDIGAAGISAATMADPERALAFQLLPGRTAAKLQFSVTPIDHTLTMLVDYPVFYAPTVHPSVFWESSLCAALLWPNGPGIRWGNWVWYDPSTGFQDPPELAGLGVKSSIIDYLCFRRVVLQGVDPVTGGTPNLLTELGTMFDAIEGPASIAVVDKFSLSFPLPKGSDETMRWAMVNSFSEVPPMACFPCRGRDTADWSQTKPYQQEVWDWSQEARLLIAAGSTYDSIQAPGPPRATWTGADTSIMGWTVASHIHMVDNTEDDSFYADASSGDLARVSPWHGYMVVGIPLSARPMGYDVSKSFRHCRTFGKPATGTFWLGAASNLAPIAWVDVDSGITATWARPRFADLGDNSPIGVMYGDGTNVYWARTYDEGQTYRDTTALGGGTVGDWDEGANGAKWFFKVLSSDGGVTFDVWMKLMDRDLNVVIPWTKTNLLGIDNLAIACRESQGNDGAWRIGVFHSASSVLTTRYAPDGLTFV